MPRLALTRRVGQRVLLSLSDGKAIIIAIVEIDPQRKAVRITIEAPAEVIISREELLSNPLPPSVPGWVSEWGEI